MFTFEVGVLCGNPLQQFGSGLEPDPEPTRESGPVANTTNDARWKIIAAPLPVILPWVELAMVPVLDLAGFIGLSGNGLTPSKIDNFLSEPSL